MVTIAASRVWALSTLRRLSWTSHAPSAGKWPSRSCGPDSVSCKGAGCPCLCLDLGLPLVAAGGALLLAVAGLVLRWRWGIPLQGTNLRGLLFPPALRSLWSCRGNWLDPLVGVPLVSFGAPPDDRMSIAASEGEPDLSGDDDSAPLPPSGRSAVPVRIQRWWLCLPGPPKGSGSSGNLHRVLNPLGWTIWFLGVARAGSQGPTPVPFFPEVHDELTGSWTAPFTARNRSSGSSSLTTLDGGAARGYMEIPPVERSVAMQLCPNTAATWRGNPLLPPGPVGTRRPWPAVLMRLWWSCFRPTCYGVVAGSSGQGTEGPARGWARTQKFSKSFVPLQTSRYERRRSLRGLWALRCPLWWSRNAISGCVWLTWRSLTRCGSWMPLCPRPAFSATQWRTSPSSSRCTEADWGHQAHPAPACSCCLHPAPVAAPQSTSRRGRHPATAPAPTQQSQQPPSKQRRGAGRRAAAPPVQAPAKPGGKCKSKRPWDGQPGDGGGCSSGDGERTTPSPGGGPGGESFVYFSPPLASRSVVPKNSTKEQFPLSLGPQRGWGVVDEPVLSHTHPPLSPVSSCGRFESVINRTTHAPSARMQVSVAHTLTLFRTASRRPKQGPCVPPRCPTAGTSVVPLVSLVQFLGAWLALPSPSCWLRLTIRLGYAIQFARHPPKFRGIHFTSVKAVDAPVLRAEIAVLLAKDAIEPVPPADMRTGFYSPYFIVPKKRRWVETNLGSARPEPGPSQASVQDAHAETYLRMHPSPRLVCSDRPEGRVLPCVDPSAPQAIPAVCVRRTAYQYKVLPFGLSLSPRVFTKVAEAALVPMREQGVRILNYLDDWLILAQSQDQLCEHRDWVLSHLSQLGLRVNWEKSKLSPTQRISFLGMELDSVSQTACLTQECAQSVLNCLNTFKSRTAVQRLLGHMAATAAVTPLGLLHMRPLQHWLHGRIPRWAWQRGTHRVQVTPACHQTLTPWSDLSFLRAGVPLEQVSRHAVVYMDASTTGWGATFNGLAVSGVWTGPQLHWHINCLELLAVRLALIRLKSRLRGRCVHQPTRWSTLPSHVATRPPPPPLESEASEVASCHSHSRLAQTRAADELSRAVLPGEWRLHPQTVQLCGEVSGQLR